MGFLSTDVVLRAILHGRRMDRPRNAINLFRTVNFPNSWIDFSFFFGGGVGDQGLGFRPLGTEEPEAPARLRRSAPRHGPCAWRCSPPLRIFLKRLQ